MKPLRKGAKALQVDGVEFGWKVGRSMVEIRNLETNRAYHLPRIRVDTEITGCDCCDMGWGTAVLPADIAHFIQTAKDEHGLL